MDAQPFAQGFSFAGKPDAQHGGFYALFVEEIANAVVTAHGLINLVGGGVGGVGFVFFFWGNGPLGFGDG